MAKLSRKVGATSQIFQVFIADSSSTTGAGLTGIVFNTSGLTAYYHRDTDTTATAISLVTMTAGTFTSSGFKEIDSTNMPGWYQFCPPNAALASGAASVAFHLKGVTNMAPLPIEVDLDAQVDVALWNGTAVSSPATAGIPDVNVKNMNNVAATSITTINANQGTTQPINFTGTAGSALAKSDMVDIAGAAVSTTTAQIGANAVQLNSQTITAAAGVTFPSSVASPTNISGGTITTVTNLTNAPTSGDLTATMKTSVTTAATAATPTAASVTGNIGGNVVGSVGSVVATVAANLTQILGTALTETAGQIAAGFKQFFNIASPTSTMNLVTGVATATNLTNAPTSGDFTATMKTSLNAATPASVVGAVGSVTGNVGGSVGSVTARVTANADQLAGQTVTAAAGVTFPTSVASPTNITAGTIATVTNLTNAPTSGDFTATMKSSLNAATPASVVGAVGSVTGNVGGNVVGSVASVVADVGITQAGADKVFGASGAAMAELAGVPAATPNPRAAIMLPFMALRNKLTTTSSEKTLYNDAGSAIAAKALSDDGSTYTEAELA